MGRLNGTEPTHRFPYCGSQQLPLAPGRITRLNPCPPNLHNPEQAYIHMIYRVYYVDVRLAADPKGPETQKPVTAT